MTVTAVSSLVKSKSSSSTLWVLPCLQFHVRFQFHIGRHWKPRETGEKEVEASWVELEKQTRRNLGENWKKKMVEGSWKLGTSTEESEEKPGRDPDLKLEGNWNISCSGSIQLCFLQVPC